METSKNIARILKDHEKRIAEIESLVFKRKTLVAATKRKSLPDYILELRDRGFFTQPVTPEEAHIELGVSYRCEKSRVEVALQRLAHRKLLRKASKIVDDNKRQAYVW